MLDIFEEVARMRAAGERGALATVISTRGSTPGKETMRLLVRESGSFLGSVPQVATYIYTWAFLLPGAGLFGHVELAAHVELVIFLATLASLPLLVTWVASGRRIAASWSALFLFPGIFVYDANLNGGADHILAFWTIPFVLALRRFWRTPDRRWGVLVAVLAGAAVMTKYQAMYVVIPGVALWMGRALTTALRAPAPAARREAWIAIGCAAAVGVAVTAPMWLKNWIWYGNPVFPFLHERVATLVRGCYPTPKNATGSPNS